MRTSKYSKSLLETLVNDSESFSSVIKKIGISRTGGNYRHITSLILKHEIDTSHFTGKSWSKNKTAEDNLELAERRYKALADEDLFSEKSSRKIDVVKLLTLGWKYECTICKIDSWQENPITLHVDHINGNHSDNRLNNLRFLCPNCHQQTETWGNKGNKSTHKDYRNYKPFIKTENELNERIKRIAVYRQQTKSNFVRLCKQCSEDFTVKTTRAIGNFCSNACKYEYNTKHIPSKEQLQQDFIELKSFVQVGKKYSVSDNAVRKWYKKYEMSI